MRNVINDSPCNVDTMYQEGYTAYVFDDPYEPLTTHQLWRGDRPLCLIVTSHGALKLDYTETLTINSRLTDDEGREVESFIKEYAPNNNIDEVREAARADKFRTFAQAINSMGGLSFSRNSVSTELQQVFPFE